jgi:hypothetical protein
VLFLAPIVLAANPTTTDVERLIKKGTDLRRQGQDHQALPLLQKAFELARTGRTAAQLGLCEMQLGYFLPASDHIGEALSATNDPWVEKYRTILEQTLRQAKTHVAEVSISGSPPGAEVSIDDRVVGHLPIASPIRVGAGVGRKVELRAEGYLASSETVDTRGGEQVRVVLHLSKVADGPLANVGHPSVSALQMQAPQKGREDSSGWSAGRVTGWVLLGAGIVGVTAGVLALRAASPNCDAPPDAVCNEGTRSKVPGWALVGGGATAGIVGGILLFTAGGRVDVVSSHRSFLIALRGPL